MKKPTEQLRYFTNEEKLLWTCSVIVITLAFIEFDGSGWLTLAASLIGVTSLLFNAKGNPVGPILMIVFSLIYGYISLTFAYYGELITYVGMTLPMSAWSLIAWLRHPYRGRRAEVTVNAHLRAAEWALLTALTAAVTTGFYFILSALGTANIIPSTVSVATSFAAAYLTARRSPCYAAAYALNDMVLIVLWVLACAEDPGYVSVVVCFVAFLVNDIYGFVSWRRMQERQSR